MMNPSNFIAAQSNPGKTVFPNLARRQSEANKEDPEVDGFIVRELTEAGIKAEGPHDWLRKRGEVPSSYIGLAYMWSFTRAWYYWIAKGPGIPADKAEEFHQKWGTQVRVDGHCGCPSPLQWHHGFAVGHYHIDTQEGLSAVAALLKSIHICDGEEKEGINSHG